MCASNHCFGQLGCVVVPTPLPLASPDTSFSLSGHSWKRVLSLKTIRPSQFSSTLMKPGYHTIIIDGVEARKISGVTVSGHKLFSLSHQLRVILVTLEMTTRYIVDNDVSDDFCSHSVDALGRPLLLLNHSCLSSNRRINSNQTHVEGLFKSTYQTL
ncbi:hypothetical protein TNCV_235631 [Trichonephila clavipes]|uniref:Uncharacterized protein n=1 Tax=Trichonephila clavipes TaxID=2585209 RepID=A0A8X6SP46_TRICX|nr:hypothetical protein TNCV_235631 [Trichonephila clavipes]